MTAQRVRRRGEPLLVFAIMMLCWVGLRVAAWRVSHPEAEAAPAKMAMPLNAAALAAASEARLAVPLAAVGRARSNPWQVAPLVVALSMRRASVGSSAERQVAPVLLHSAAQDSLQGVLPAMPDTQPGLAGRHAPPWPAIMAGTPPLAPLLAAVAQPVVPAILSQPPGPSARRWSADGWTLVRGGGGGGSGIAGAGPSVATYGGSQIGAVLRYRLIPGSPHRPAAYVRISAALTGSGEREVAAGLSVRPFGALPIYVAAEGRVGRLWGGRTVVRPAAMAVTELAPITLPLGALAEAYLQAGYVGGTGATPFIDAQLRVDKRVAQVGPVELRAGGGGWTGAQHGAGRLDVGPSVTLSMAHGPAAARIGLDWRFRVGGEAEPASGPALTISAGF